jgi:hypothetical protein
MGDEIRYLFIAGAARSGTTLITNLLDGHQDLLVFPMEHKVFKKYFTNPAGRRSDYFSTDFIEHRTEGQQSVLGSRALFEAYRARMQREFAIDFRLDVDAGRFLDVYRASISDADVSLETIFRALSEALMASRLSNGEAGPRPRWAVFKDPFTTEFFAQHASRELTTARYLHVIRDPYARYASFKKRQLRRGRVLPRSVVPRINFRDFVSGFAEQAIASLHRGLENQRVLGPDRYRIVRFEDVVADPEAELRELSEWLDVDFDAAMLQPSRLGKSTESGSSFSPTSRIDPTTVDRGRAYFMDMTSSSERDVYNRCLALSDYGRYYALIHPTGDGPSLYTWSKPYKHERLRDYAWRLASRQGFVESDAEASALKTRLPDLYLRGVI